MSKRYLVTRLFDGDRPTVDMQSRSDEFDTLDEAIAFVARLQSRTAQIVDTFTGRLVWANGRRVDDEPLKGGR